MMEVIYFALTVSILVTFIATGIFFLKRKNIHIWIFSYLKEYFKRKLKPNSRNCTHIMFCLVDHFEPKRGNVNREKEIERVSMWIQRYSRLLKTHKDWEEIPPKYTFFYPIDECSLEVMDILSKIHKKGWGEVEIHLHHNGDTPSSLKEKLEYGKEIFSRYGFLSKNKFTGEIGYAFVHGNWALDNSRKDGKWCGVNNELEILKETGCFADFTLPSWPSETQTKKINSIYYAKDTPDPKSHNVGRDVEAGKRPWGDLMLIQGPLALNWKRRKWGIFPKVENGEISSINLPTTERIDLWIKQRISVKGKPDWIFVKVYTHGVRDDNLKEEFFKGLDSMFSYLEKKYNDGSKFRLHYVTAREMYNIIKAAEAGKKGNPSQYRDYIFEPLG